MPEINGTYIENKSQENINKELSKDYKNFEKIDGYNKEMAALGKKYLDKMGEKIKSAREKIIDNKSLKEKYPEKYDQFAQKFKKYQNEITEHTKSLNNKERRKRHEVHINKLGSIIDNYENEAIKLIQELVEDMGDSETIQKEKGKVETANAKAKYVEIGEDGIYKLTKATNKPKIHQVLGNVLSPGEVRKIDYAQCTNNSIKTRMINAISSSEYENTQQTTSCFLQHDSTKKTYVLSDGNGNILTQRALIREGVKLIPPSKIKKEARIAKKEGEKARIEKINNINLSKQEQQDLFDSMPEKLRKKLKKEDRDAFFQITESSINEAIKQAKLEGYELQSEPVGKHGGRDYYVTLNLRNAGSKAEVERPFIKKEDLRKYGIKDNNKFKNYISQRVSTKRNSFDYLTKKGSTIKEGEYGVGNELNENEKTFAIKGLQMLGNWADAVLDKIGNTKRKDDDVEFTALKTYTRDVINNIETGKFTDKNIESTKEKISGMLSKFFKHNRFRSSMQINENEIKGCINNILSSQNKESQIIAMRKLGASRTRFDNSETAFLREEIFDTFNRVEKRDENGNIILDEEGNPVYEERDIDLKDDNYEKYFTRIKELYQIDPEVLESSGEIPSDKKQAIDELYNAARTCTGKHGVKNFKRRLLNKGLIPDWTGHGGQIDDKVRALKMQLEQQEKNANKFQITADEIRQRTKQGLAELQLSLTSKQIQSAEGGDAGEKDEGIRMLNAYNFMLQQDDSFFQDLATKESEDTKKSIKYCGVDGVVRGNLAPYLIRRGGGINSESEMAKIYNDSVGAGGWLDFSDEGAENIGPLLKEIIVEVVVTAVSILLCWNGAGEAIYAAFRTAKLAVQAMKGIRKYIQFMKIFAKQLLKHALTQGLGKLKIGATKIGKTAVGGAKAASQIVRASESLGRRGQLAVKGTSLIIEGTTFHINSTIIHNIMNGEDWYQGLNPFDYTEGPDGEKISNLQSYAQSIAFLGVLKFSGKLIGRITNSSLQSLTGKEIQNLAKGRYGPATVNKIFSTSLSLSSEMGSMMLTDQILSLTFDQSLKPITGEELITMFGMIVGLRLNGKFQMRIKEHSGRKTIIRMEQGGTGNKFDVSIDHEGNILKVEGVDKNGNRIPNPEQICGLKAGENGMNMRDIPNAIGNNTGTIEGGRQAERNLENLNTGDEISVNHGEHTIKLKKTVNGKREVSDPGGSTFERGTKFDVERNPNDNSYHLKNSEGRGTISLDGQINVRLQSRFGTEIRSGNTERPGDEGILIEGGNQRVEELNRLRENKQTIEAQRNETKTRLEEIQREQEEIRNKINNNNNSKKEQIKIENKLKQKKEELNNKKNELEAQRLRLQDQLLNTAEYNNIGIVSLTDFPLKKGNKVSIGGKKCKYIGIVEGKLTFKPDDGGELKRYSSFKDLNEAKIKFDIESRQELGRSQQEIFNKLVEREIAQGRKAELQLRRNNLIEEINNLVKNNENFELNKAKLSGKNIRINGVEYKISLTKKGLLRFVEVKGQGDFTINSFKQLLDMGQINGFSDGYARSGSMIRGSETLTRSEIENHRLIEDILNIEIQNNSRIAQKKLELNQIESELSQVPQGERVANPEYQRIQKEIAEIDGKITNIEGEIRVNEENLLNNQSEQIRLETELRELKAQEGEINGRYEKALQEYNNADQQYNNIENELRNMESETQNHESQIENGNNNPGQHINLETEFNGLRIKNEELNYHERQIQLLQKNTTKLESQLREMKGNIGGEIEINGHKVAITRELIESTKRQIQLNNKNLNEHRIFVEQTRGGAVNIESDGTITILKTDYSTEKILPDGTICKGDFGPNGDLVSGVKFYSNGNIEYGSYNERGELTLGMKEIKLQDGGFKQTYTTLDGIYEVKFDSNNNMIGNMENISGSNHTTVINEKSRSIFERFKKFKEDFSKKEEQRRQQQEAQRRQQQEEQRRQQQEQQRNSENNPQYIQKEESRRQEREQRYKGESTKDEAKHLFRELSKTFHTDKIQGKIETKFEEIVGRTISDQEKGIFKIYENKINDKCNEVSKKIGEIKLKLDSKIKSGKEPKEELEELRKLYDQQDKIEDEIRKEVIEQCNEIKEQERIQREEQERIQREEQERKQKEEQERRQREEQERKQKEEQEKEKKKKEEQERKQREEQENNRYTEKVKLTENINVDYKSWNMSKEVKEYFDKTKFEKPFFEVDIDGQKIFLTRPHSVQRYTGLIGFVEVNGQYQIRCFIKSGSEGLWRCCPGYREEIGNKQVSKLDEFNPKGMSPEIEEQYKQAGFNFTGNFSYERSTMVDFRLQEIIDDIYVETYSESGKYYDPNRFICATELDGFSKKFDPEMAKRCIDMSKEIDIIDDFSNNFRKNFSECTIDEVKNTYKTETLGIDINSFKIEKGKKYQYYHVEFDCWIDVEVYTAKMGGKDVEIFFSHTEKEPDLIWIDNIQYKNQTINSYGIPSQQINAGWLTKKPIDYTRQCPKGYKGTAFGFDYMDIRPLYQESPIIKKYKELSQQQGYSKAA